MLVLKVTSVEAITEKSGQQEIRQSAPTKIKR